MSTPMKMSTDSDRPVIERRRRERIAGETNGWVFPPQASLQRHGPAEEQGWEVRVLDVSRFGVGFISTAALETGSMHQLRIGRGPMHRARLVRVVVCRQEEGGAYCVGAEFLDSGHRPMSKAG
jgi:hypothetical protein